jgi:rare lipoprotein A
MDAPPVLLTGLRTLLEKEPPAPTPKPAATKAVAEKPKPAPKPKPSATQPAAEGRYEVQVAAFSTRGRADGVAKAMHGSVQPAGRYFRVRLGPFATRAEADRARDAAATRGYGDARVLTDD